MDPPEEIVLGFGQLLEELDGDLLTESVSSRVIVPKKGKLFDSDGNGRMAIIRPCVSRGKRIRGMPPVYTPNMLSEHARIFTGWPMYMDHLAEQALHEMSERLIEQGHEDIAQALQEARSVRELGGRILRAYWNPDMVFEDDDDYGFQRGGVEAIYRPQTEAKRMLEADPGILQMSINAWPKGARSGPVPWDKSRRGMLIEGIRAKPVGSVDFVFKAGAGGRPLFLQEDDGESRAVSVLEAGYSAATRETRPPSKMTPKPLNITADTTADELREQLEAAGASHLVEALAPKQAPGKGSGSGDQGGLTEERVTQIVTQSLERFGETITEQLEEAQTSSRDAADERLQERAEAAELETLANKLLSEAVTNGLPEKWGEEIGKRYTLLPSGAASGLLVEAETDASGAVTKDKAAVLKERVMADVRHAAGLIEASGGTARVKGLGASETDPNGEADQVSEAEQGEPTMLEESLGEWGVAEEEFTPGKPKAKEPAGAAAGKDDD